MDWLRRRAHRRPRLPGDQPGHPARQDDEGHPGDPPGQPRQRPNLRGLTALNSEEPQTMSFMDKLIEKMGLKAGATEDDILAALPGTETPALQSALTEIGTALGVQGGETAAIVAAAKLAGTGKDSLISLQAQVETLTTKLKETETAKARATSEAFIDTPSAIAGRASTRATAKT